MSEVQYPFIDIAVHQRVRARFAAGDALVLFSRDMTTSLWANGRGAALFGFSAIYDLLDQGPSQVDMAFRQAKAAAGQLVSVGDQRSVTVRMASGFQRIVVQASCELVSIQGREAVLFSAPATAVRNSETDRARAMIEGFDDPDTHIAVLDRDGQLIGQSEGFAGLGISSQAAGTLMTMADHDPNRMVKRPVATAKGYLPAAIGKVSDDPALYLLLTIDTAGEREGPIATFEPRADDRQPEIAQPTDMSAVAFADAIDAVAGIEETDETAEEPEEISLDDAQGLPPETTSQEAMPATEQNDTHMPVETATDTTETEGNQQPVAESAPEEIPAPDLLTDEAPIAAETVEPAETVAPPETAVPAETSIATEVAASLETPVAEETETDGAAETAAPAPVPEEASEPDGFSFRHDLRAMRFVWKVDAEGRFTEVSDEFAQAVGPHAADITGMAFSDLAALFQLDPDGKIAELLGKRDTWSGKTIYWPVESTSLMVPVDLAALPTYTRTREFDGFRGFGIVRLADAVEDPHALGLTLGTEAAVQDIADDAPADADTVEQAETSGYGDFVLGDEPSVEPVAPPADMADVPVDQAIEPEAATEHENPKTATPDTPAPVVPSLLDFPAGERPALRLVENPGRRYSDKVIKFEEHRARLTPGEQATFREIARQIDTFVGARQDQPTATPDKANENEAPAAAETAAAPTDNKTSDHATAPETGPEQVEDVIVVANENVELQVTEVSEPEAEASAGASEPESPADLEETTPEKPLPGISAPPEPTDAELLGQMIPLRERTGLSADIIDQMPVALLVHSGDRLIHGNPEFLKLTGYTSLADLADVGGLDALLQRQDLEGKTTEAGGMVVVREDDVIVPVTARLQSVRWGDATALMLALMPVAAESDTRPADQPVAQVVALASQQPPDQLSRLQVEVEELRAILETATDGVVILGAEGDIRSMNRAASALFNFDNEEINGKPFVTLFAHESQRAILDYLGGLSGHGVASVLNDGREVIGREASGGFIPLFMTIGKLTSSNGYCAVIRDITQWKRTEEELRTAKRAAETANAHKSDFLAHVSHEIRTPLNAIIGFSDMMATERFGPIGHARYIEYANDIGRSGRHVLDIVNDLLDISKIEAGEMDLEFIAVGLNETVSEAVSLVQPQANGQRVIIRTALSHSVPQVVADLRSIKQIVLNILSNAIRFTPSGGQIVVSTAYESNGSVVLRIRDTGIGMTRSELELAMKPFRQVAGSTRKRGDGTGLGLPLTKAMVDANRATFAISSAPNEGTLVEVTFPSQRVLAN